MQAPPEEKRRRDQANRRAEIFLRSRGLNAVAEPLLNVALSEYFVAFGWRKNERRNQRHDLGRQPGLEGQGPRAMVWRFNPETSRTDDGDLAIIRRVHVEAAIDRLVNAGIRNRFELVRILEALTGLRRIEVIFNVGLVAAEREAGLAGGDENNA